ncbi:hypothetical protein [Nocardia lasii]|uniref:Transposase n=1 Tax=Nocardia lasii TaxID=1616107 RepID=A0ABW1JRB3_9NOCA
MRTIRLIARSLTRIGLPRSPGLPRIGSLRRSGAAREGHPAIVTAALTSANAITLRESRFTGARRPAGLVPNGSLTRRYSTALLESGFAGARRPAGLVPNGSLTRRYPTSLLETGFTGAKGRASVAVDARHGLVAIGVLTGRHAALPRRGGGPAQGRVVAMVVVVMPMSGIIVAHHASCTRPDPRIPPVR